MSAVFLPLPWHRPLWQLIAAAVGESRLGHALLLAGPAGTGKRHFAQCLTAAIWCRKRLEDGIACGECADCLQVRSEVHSGFHFLRVEEDKRDISIEAVRALSEKLQMTTHDGRAKIAIVDPADALNVNGVNALLKTIEEPSPNSHLILIAERPQALTATLRSRCQRLRFAIPPSGDALHWLKQNTPPETTDANLDQALSAAFGAPLRARQLIESKSLVQHAQWLRHLLDLAAGKGEPLAAAAAIGEGNVAGFTPWLYGWLTGLLRTRAAPPAANDLALLGLAERLPPALLDRYVVEVQDALFRVQTNANKTLLLESLLIGWTGLLARSDRTAQNAAR